MATFANDLAGINQFQARQIKCNVARLMQSLDTDDAKALGSVMNDPSVTHRALALWLIKHDHKIGYDSIRRHRTRHKGAGCQCPKEA